MKDMKKILFVITAPSAGGTETYLLRFLEYIDGIYPVVLCKKSVEGDLRERYEKVALLINVGHLGFFNPLPYKNLFDYLKINCFDAICDFTGNFAVWDLICAKMANIPLRVAFYREARNQFKPSIIKNVYAKFATKITQGVATRILSNSQEALSYFYPNWKYVSGEKYEVIYNGLDMGKLSKRTKEDVRLELNLPADAFVICHTGRYIEAKNHRMVISCAIKLCRMYSDIHFVLLGKGVGETFSANVNQSGLNDRIHFLGYRKDVLDVLKCADLFYFPSLNEGQPNALIEAIASGLPFVASNIPSIIETIPTDKLPNLVSPIDIQENISAIKKFYLNRNLLENSQCSLWTQEKFNSEVLFNQFFNVLL